MTLLGLLMAVLAFGLFGLATDAHHGRWFGWRPSAARKQLMRRAAWVLIAAGFMVSVAARGSAFGPVLWFGTLMFGAAVVFLALNLVAPPARAVSNAHARLFRRNDHVR